MPKALKIAIYVVLILLILFVLNKYVFKGLKNAVFSVFSPIERALWSDKCVLCNSISKLFEFKNVKNENKELLKQTYILKSKLIELDGIEKENQALRQAMDMELEDEYSMIMAEIVAKKNEMDAIIINKGREHGVSEGMAVITKEKVLVGRIDSVLNKFSQITLISDKNFSFSVEIGEDDVIGVAKGKGSFNVRIELISKESVVNVGDTVSSSLLGGMFPKNLLVGEIEKVERKDAEPFQEADVLPYFLKSDLQYVFLLEK